jgi:hypothetical protein
MFNGMPPRDIVTWNSMVDSYVSNDIGALTGLLSPESGIIAALATGCLEPQCKGGIIPM